MGIEQDIQQTKGFRNERQKICVNLLYSSSWLQERIKLFLQSEGITPQQYNILRILRGSGKPISTLQIRERMLDKMSDTSRIVERLLKKELVEKTICVTDKRLVDVVISPKGLDVLKRLDDRNNELDSIPAALSEEEATIVNVLLDKMRDKAQVEPIK